MSEGPAPLLAAPGMLLIGAAGRNMGKTELACEILRRTTPHQRVVGVKVTTVRERGGPCPRGGEGCGVCGALEDDFCLGEEPPAANAEQAAKDTQRMRAAGAVRVLWLRVLADRLREGAAALLEALGPDAVSVCESNSLRSVVAPDDFVIVRDGATGGFKPSARAVLPHADLLVGSDGARFDPPPDAFGLAEGRWTVRRPATAIVLAGGQSTRMGRDKALLEWGGQPLIARVVGQLEPFFDEILVSGNDPERYAFLGKRVVPDEVAGEGPLMGIVTAMAAARHDTCFVTACDVPELPRDLLRRLLREARGADGAVPVSDGERYEPLFAVYHRRALPVARRLLARGVRKVLRLFDEADFRRVRLERGEELTNVNTPEDYEGLRGP